MAFETKTSLTDETIDKIQKLIRANIDAYDGFTECAEQIEDPSIAKLFRELADERSELATELQNYVEWNGKEAEEQGTFAAQVHRAWIAVRSTLSGGDAYAVLAEAERGEDHIKHAYEEVLRETAGSALNDVLQAQYFCVKRAHDRVRDMRDGFKDAT